MGRGAGATARVQAAPPLASVRPDMPEALFADVARLREVAPTRVLVGTTSSGRESRCVEIMHPGLYHPLRLWGDHRSLHLIQFSGEFTGRADHRGCKIPWQQLPRFARKLPETIERVYEQRLDYARQGGLFEMGLIAGGSISRDRLNVRYDFVSEDFCVIPGEDADASTQTFYTIGGAGTGSINRLSDGKLNAGGWAEGPGAIHGDRASFEFLADWLQTVGTPLAQHTGWKGQRVERLVEVLGYQQAVDEGASALRMRSTRQDDPFANLFAPRQLTGVRVA